MTRNEVAEMSSAFHQGRAEAKENLSCRAIEVITAGATSDR